MAKSVIAAIVFVALGLLAANWNRATVLSQGAAPAEGPVTFKVVFGERQDRTADYSGTVSLSDGKVLRITPWRFFAQDAVNGVTGWKLVLKRIPFENQPDQPRPISTPGQNLNIVPAGVYVTIEASSSARVTLATKPGNVTFSLADLRHGKVLSFFDGDVWVQRTPTSQQLSPPENTASAGEHDYPSVTVTRNGVVWVAWQTYENLGEHVWVRYSTASGWSEPYRLTDAKGDVFGTAVGEDAGGGIWVVWSERKNDEWNLFARVFDGRQWSATKQLTSGHGPNAFHRLVRGKSGKLHLIWIGHQDAKSRVYWSALENGRWSQPQDISGPSAWMPNGAVDSADNLYVAWDSYRNGNYDIFLRKIEASGALGPVQQVTQSPRFQAHASVAVDKQDRVWVAWDESGANWGKDWSRDDTWRGTTLYTDRRTRVAVLENGVWKQPADVMGAIPRRYNRYVENPRIAVDAHGRVWLAVQVRVGTTNNRTDFWANNGRWEFFLTSYEGDHWAPAAPIPATSSRPDGPFQMVAAAKGIWSVWSNDNRLFGGPGRGGARAVHYEVDAAPYSFEAPVAPAVLEEYMESPGAAAEIHRDEAGDVARIRAYRSGPNRILRGDFHRHTEISGDGAGDGSLEDYFRYMIDAASMDTGIVSDHNAGNDNEYTWWRTEKAIDLFRIPGGFTPLFGYERSVSYPNGHRNVVFPQRGVRTLPISKEEQQGKINSGSVLYPYLKQHRGICMLHSLATDQGTDYRDNDPEVEPLVEIYQGYHANYEYPGAPRAEAPGYTVYTHGPFRPLGFYWNALAKGYKLGVESSSDHISTHSSYTMIYTAGVSRSEIVESMRARRAYGATDNIILDFQAVGSDGKPHWMGEVISSATPPKFTVKAIGTGDIDVIEIIKDRQFVYTMRPGGPKSEFHWADNAWGAGESWYYVRVIQADRNMAWSSPIWVKRAK